MELIENRYGLTSAELAALLQLYANGGVGISSYVPMVTSALTRRGHIESVEADYRAAMGRYTIRYSGHKLTDSGAKVVEDYLAQDAVRMNTWIHWTEDE